MASLYEQLGGESKLSAIIHDFIGRVFADVMIGFDVGDGAVFTC